MGALAPITPWKPEDDLLLKNAVEAGASLESLAKGAVQFSRRFTVRELQDRWHSLLYDPVLSGEASARMIEFERSASTLPSKFNRFGNSKENKCVPGKRKAETIRSCYYALRKRICNEPFNSMDLSFLVAPSNSNCVGNGDEPVSPNYMLEDPISNHFRTQEPSLDIMHCAFPQMVTDNAAASGAGTSAHGFHAAVQNPVKEDLPIEQNSIHKDIPQILGENLPHTGNCSGIDELGEPKELLACNLFEADDLEAKPPSTFDLINSDLGNVCSEFGGNQAFDLPGSDCGASFDNLGYSSPLPGMPIWDTVEGISASDIPVDTSLGKKDHHTEDTFALPNDGHAKINSVSGYDVVPSETKLKNSMPCDQLNNSSPDGYLAELSNSLLDFPNDELLFMDVDGKDIIDKSYYDGLNSLLLSSPTDSNQDHVPDITEPEASVGPDAYLVIPQGACAGELDNNGSIHCGDGHADCNPEAPMLSTAVDLNPQFPEMCNGVICCALNTEDPDIPCNEDVFLPNQIPLSPLSSAAQLSFHEANNPTSSAVKDFTDNQKSSERCPSLLKRELKSPGQSHVSSRMKGSQALSKIGLNHPVGDCDIKFELTESDSTHMASRSAGLVCGNSSLNPVNVKAHTPLPKMLKEETKEIKPARQMSYNSTDSFMEKPVHGFDGFRNYPQTNACGIKQEVDAISTAQNHQGLDFAALDPVVNPSSPDQEEQPIESDDDIPYVSDIEAMILDMDLDPDDQEYCRGEVSRYQYENTKRAIIRLEQGFHSYMQRTIATHGAFAVLYGRHSKHYIKKPEVLLGRATEDVTVDIDLGREGCANKISRRQAIIKMERGGSFSLKNLGKRAILMNGKDVAPGESVSLTCGCLIEIRGMPFIFETNQNSCQAVCG